MIIGSVVGICCLKKFETPAYGRIKNNQILMQYIRLRGMEQGIWDKKCDVVGEGLIEENRVLREFIKNNLSVNQIVSDKLKIMIYQMAKNPKHPFNS